MREAVSCIFINEDQVFMAHRQNYLRAFPGYHAFPGGKVDKEDSIEGGFEHPLFKKYPHRLMKALCSEMKEELGVDIIELLKKGLIEDIHEIGIGVTPDFKVVESSDDFKLNSDTDNQLEFALKLLNG